MSMGLGQERQFLLENLALLMEAGVSVQSALESIKNEVRSKRLQRLISEMQEAVDSGQNFSTALESSGLLPDYFAVLVRLGEDSGRLTENLKVVIRQQEKDRLFKAKLRTAMLYPGIIMVLALVIGLGIAWFILPKLGILFRDLKVSLPLPTRLMIGFGTFLRQHGLFVLGGIAASMIAFILVYIRSAKVRAMPARVASHLPVIRKLFQEIELARFGYITGSLLEAGLPIVEVFQALAKASRLSGYRKLYERMAEGIENGETFRAIFKADKSTDRFLPRPLQELIIAGEQSGKLAPTLLHLGEIYEEKIDNTSKNLAILLEPIMLVIVWLMVVGIALAVILPIYKLIGGLQ